jgi:hypothetical protein
MVARFSGATPTPGCLPEALAAPQACNLVSFAVTTLLEGCVNEGAAAEAARIALERAQDPEVRASLAVIVANEAHHAALAWYAVAWCCTVGGDAVRHALVAAIH